MLGDSKLCCVPVIIFSGKYRQQLYFYKIMLEFVTVGRKMDGETGGNRNKT